MQGDSVASSFLSHASLKNRNASLSYSKRGQREWFALVSLHLQEHRPCPSHTHASQSNTSRFAEKTFVLRDFQEVAEAAFALSEERLIFNMPLNPDTLAQKGKNGS